MELLWQIAQLRQESMFLVNVNWIYFPKECMIFGFISLGDQIKCREET